MRAVVTVLSLINVNEPERHSVGHSTRYQCLFKSVTASSSSDIPLSVWTRILWCCRRHCLDSPTPSCSSTPNDRLPTKTRQSATACLNTSVINKCMSTKKNTRYTFTFMVIWWSKYDVKLEETFLISYVQDGSLVALNDTAVPIINIQT